MLDWSVQELEAHRVWLAWYRRLLNIRMKRKGVMAAVTRVPNPSKQVDP